MERMEWMEGAHARGGSGHRLRLHPRVETNPGKQATWSGLLPWEMLPGKSYSSPTALCRRTRLTGLLAANLRGDRVFMSIGMKQDLAIQGDMALVGFGNFANKRAACFLDRCRVPFRFAKIFGR